MPLDLMPLVNAVARLQEGWQRYRRDISDTQIRDGLVQRFEFTYEISQKMLKRYLEESAASPDQFDSMPFADLIRSANEQGLLQGDWPAWRGYRDMRSKTSHTYDEDIALQVVVGIPAFISEAAFLAEQLQQPLPLILLAEVAEAFSESDLPWKVDLVDWATSSERFQQVISKQKMPVQAELATSPQYFYLR